MPVRITGIKGVRDAITRMSQDITDVERKLIEWALEIEDMARASASLGETPEGQPWEPRKTTTVRQAGKPATARSSTEGQVGRVSGKMIRGIIARVNRKKARLTQGAGGARYSRYFIGYSSRQPPRRLMPTHETGRSSRALTEWAERLADRCVEVFREGGSD
jgi:hypothetical protein